MINWITLADCYKYRAMIVWPSTRSLLQQQQLTSRVILISRPVQYLVDGLLRCYVRTVPYVALLYVDRLCRYRTPIVAFGARAAVASFGATVVYLILRHREKVCNYDTVATVRTVQQRGAINRERSQTLALLLLVVKKKYLHNNNYILSPFIYFAVD